MILYSPVLNEKLVRTIYRLKRVYKKPMTEVTASLIQQSLKALDKKIICKVCIGEQNNDCEQCCLNGKGANNVE